MDDTTPKPQQKWASDADFTTHRKKITDLYHAHPLPVLMRTMEAEYNFFATPKMYKTRFRRWGLWKHNQASTVTSIIQLKRQRDAAHKPSEFTLNGRPVNYERIKSYLRRNEKMRRLLESSSALPTVSPDTKLALAARTPSPSPEPVTAPTAFRNEEQLYHAIRNYYAGAFGAGRWVFEGSDERAVATKQGLRRGQEIWLRFRTALRLLERGGEGGANGGKEGDYAQGVRLVRISFAELEGAVLGGYVMTVFRESTARDFRVIETQLLKYLYELTAAGGHAMGALWKILWLAGFGIDRHRHHLQTCLRVAQGVFEKFNPVMAPQTVDLLLFGVINSLPPGVGDPALKEAGYSNLFARLEEAGGFDGRHMDVICCWAVHRRQHRLYEQAEELLLDKVLRRPDRMRLLPQLPAEAFNVYSLLTTINTDMQRPEVAEGYVRTAIEIARGQWEATGEDGDLFEGLNGLETALRAQGKTDEADKVSVERQELVRLSLEKVGEKENSV
ncbi:hypothetical protein OQA88_2299 [Cercophora sp. LCS_1]